MLTGWRTYLFASGIAVVGAAYAVGWITEDLRNTLLVFLNALVAAALRAGVQAAENKATMAVNASEEAAASANKAAKAVK